MTTIQSFVFSEGDLPAIKDYKYGNNWPVVYVQENSKEAYVGQSTRVYFRSKEHYKNPSRRLLKKIHIIADQEFNLSAAYDIESWLIQYMAADGKYILQNSNQGLKNHEYFDREKYKAKFDYIWEDLRKMDLAKNSLPDLRNSDLFKYSPYKSLTMDQHTTALCIFEDIKDDVVKTFLVSGKPGTGKTILAIYLFKQLRDSEQTKHLKVGLVVPMTSLRKTIKKVFKNINGLSPSMVIGPNDVTKDSYDVIIVDEAHRLRRRKNITNYAEFDKINSKLGLTKEGNELQWITQCSKYQVLFYDSGQSVKPSDVRAQDFLNLEAEQYELETQLRVEGGDEYISFIENVFDQRKPDTNEFLKYDFKIYDRVDAMFADIKSRDTKHGLSRMVAGYAWPWHTKKGVEKYDIEIEGNRFIWNSTATDWVNSPNAINEVGCIHTVQGYDLNFVGVIIGPELSYDFDNQKFIVNKKLYFDRNGHAGVTDPDELERYVINIYKTLLTRGIKGTYIYIVDKNLREYINSKIN